MKSHSCCITLSQPTLALAPKNPWPLPMCGIKHSLFHPPSAMSRTVDCWYWMFSAFRSVHKKNLLHFYRTLLNAENVQYAWSVKSNVWVKREFSYLVQFHVHTPPPKCQRWRVFVPWFQKRCDSALSNPSHWLLQIWRIRVTAPNLCSMCGLVTLTHTETTRPLVDEIQHSVISRNNQ